MYRDNKPSEGIKALRSWFNVTGTLHHATGNVWRRMPLRVTINTVPCGTLHLLAFPSDDNLGACS